MKLIFGECPLHRIRSEQAKSPKFHSADFGNSVLERDGVVKALDKAQSF